VFLSPDNYVQAPENSQNFNRYSYCLNNPLRYTDPSGDFIIEAIVIAAMVYAGGMQANFMYCGNNGTNVFNPGNWNWSSGSTYTGMINGGLSGAGMMGIPILPAVPGAIPNGALQAGFVVGINGIGNMIDGNSFFEGAAIPAAMAFAGGAVAGYNMAKAKGLNVWTGVSTAASRANFRGV
jgi:hypothetical protein